MYNRPLGSKGEGTWWQCVCVCVCVCVCAHAHTCTQSCLTPCYPMGSSLPGSSIHGILQARIMEWAAMPSSRGSPHPEIEPRYPTLAGGFFTTAPPGKPLVIVIAIVLLRHCMFIVNRCFSSDQAMLPFPGMHSSLPPSSQWDILILFSVWKDRVRSTCEKVT